MKVSATPHIDMPARVEALSVSVATVGLNATDVLMAGTTAAALAAQAGDSGAVVLSPLGRAAAALAAFGLPVVELAPDTPSAAAHPGVHPSAAQGVINTLAAALSLRQVEGPEGGLLAEAEAASTGGPTPQPGALPDGSTATRQPPTQQTSAGAQLNALLCAALTGQTTLELRRRDRRPLQLELQREPDGRGGFRITRVRIRHETADGVLEAAVQMGTGAALPGERVPMSVDIACGGALSEAVSRQLDALQDALQARGLTAAVRTHAEAAPLPLLPLR